MKLAVIQTGGKQYFVEEKKKLQIEKIRDKKGKITFDKVLLLVDGEKVEVDPKKLSKKKVEGEIKEIRKDKKIKIVKFKPKKRYFKRQGHRQPIMEVEITKIK